MDTTDAGLLAESWQLTLRAERKSPQTLKTYGDAVRFYLAWCTEQNADPMSRASLNGWVAGLLDGGAAAATARARQLGVRWFAAWLTEEGKLPADPFLGVKSPKLDEKVIEPLLALAARGFDDVDNTNPVPARRGSGPVGAVCSPGGLRTFPNQPTPVTAEVSFARVALAGSENAVVRAGYGYSGPERRRADSQD